MNLKAILVIALALFSLFSTPTSRARRQDAGSSSYRGWSQFGGGPENIHYSTLDQITRENVHQLEPAWTFDTGDVFTGSEMQCNPIIVDGVMYATTPKLNVIALDAATGRLKWRFDPNLEKVKHGMMRSRGVMHWKDGAEERIYVGFRHHFYSIDAKTGKPDPAFGRGGRIDLREGFGRKTAGMSISVTTPGAIYKGMLILGSMVSEGLPAAPGDIRAFDARTGRLRWSFHTIPHPGEFGHDTWPKDAWTYSGGANNWSGLVLDEKRGLVFAPTGSAAFDFYGANRRGDNLFANTLLCLDAATGKRKWHFQAIKHDVWDRDFPSAPALVTLKRDGRSVDAVAQITKSGHVYVFDRVTGESLFPIEHRKVPTDGIDGEWLAETQPLPLAPPAFSRQRLTEDMLTTRTPEARQAALERFRKFRSSGQFDPPNREGTVICPGYDGGGEWGGAAFDPETGLLYVNANEMAWILRLVERPKSKNAPGGKSLYAANCANCHLGNLRGTPPEFPSLVGIGKKLDESEIRQVIRQGAGRMPGFARLGREAVSAIAHYVATGEDLKANAAAGKPSPIDLKYTMDGYNKFLDPDGYPAIAPPWGTLSAIDLNHDHGKIVWQIPFGEFPALAAQGVPTTGSENYGGGIVTRNGLFFIAATNHDRKFRVFDKLTGKLLWETVLPASGNSTPAMYEAGGRQFIVIGCGGGKSGAPSGGKYVAFALKR
ncbi:MAG: PQQ-binding-like beta-propeller repeat protein [Blastocatellia bacterium]